MLASVWVDKGGIFLLFSVWDHSWRSRWCVSLFLKASKALLTSPCPCFNDGAVVTCAFWLRCVHCVCSSERPPRSNAWIQRLHPGGAGKTVAKGQTIHLRTSVALKSSKLPNQRNRGAHQRRQREGVPAPSLRDSLASNRTLPLAKALIRGAVL